MNDLAAGWSLPGAGRLGRHSAWLLGMVGLLGVLLTLDGPGITVDEPLDVRPGRKYVATLWAEGGRFLAPQVVDRVFEDNAEHPPLGRWLLGIASTVFEPVEVLWKGPDPTGSYVLAGRIAPACCFSLLVGVITAAARRFWGTVAGLAAGFSTLTTPRLFAHAHLGALDTFLCLFWTLAFLGIVAASNPAQRTSRTLLAALLWALALLTKIHAWFLPLFALIALFSRCPPRTALARFALWLGAGIAGFVIGWPWLWNHGWTRFLAYLGTGVVRTPIRVEYLGRILLDRDLPWHYPLVYFAVTLPPAFLAFGGWGVIRALRTPGRRFPALAIVGVVAFFLTLFACFIPVYDQERLFLLVFPFWSWLVGWGFQDLWERLKSSFSRAILAMLLLVQAWGVAEYHPFQLSYYNMLVGGLAGARRLGLEPTYWNDAVDQRLLDRLAALARPGDQAALVPSLYPGHGIMTTSRSLVQKEIVLGDQESAATAQWVVVSRREAYWPHAFKDRLLSGRGRIVHANRRDGIWLAAIWHFEPQSPKLATNP